MKKWKKFETEVFIEINQLVSQLGCCAELGGGADSTVSDIIITTPSREKYYLEIKMPQAQSGQFVIEKEKTKYIFSKKIKYAQDKFQEKIIRIINDSSDINNAVFSNDIVSGAIKAHYERKNTKFFVTKKDKIIIIPIDEIDEYFDLGLVIRFKKSGSRNISHKDLDKFKNDEEFAERYEVEFKDDKIFFIGNFENKYILDGYYLSEIENNKFQLKKLSNTKNLTILFVITLKEKHPNSKLNDLLKILK